MPITEDTARRLLDHLNGRVALPIVAPLKLYLRGVNMGSGYTFPTPQIITLTAAERGSWSTDPDAAWIAENETALVFTNLPEMSVTNWFIEDSSPTPIKVWEGLTVRVRNVPLGDSYEVPAGALKVRLVDALDA